MRFAKLLALAAFVAMPLFVAPQSADAADFKGQMKFTSKAPKEDIFGTASGAAKLDIALGDLSTLKGKISVKVASMKTGNDTRDEHMMGSEWLDAAKHPEITFEITSVEVVETTEKDGVKAAKLKATGKFTLHGVTTTLTAPVNLKWKADGKTKITTRFTIKLADYKIAGKDGLVGSKVGETIKCEATFIGIAK